MTKTKTKTKIKAAIEGYNLRVRRENAVFRKMGPRQKRVRIAQDVIALAGENVLTPKSGIWVAGVGAKDTKDQFEETKQPSLLQSLDDLPDSGQVRDLLPGVEACNACAVGALFYCTVMRTNDLTVGELRHGDDISTRASVQNFEQITPYLKKYFPEDQLKLMELAFERGDGGVATVDNFIEQVAIRMFKTVRTVGGTFCNDASGDECEWNDDKSTDSERLLAIMWNIVRNDGLFLPELRHGT